MITVRVIFAVLVDMSSYFIYENRGSEVGPTPSTTVKLFLI